MNFDPKIFHHFSNGLYAKETMIPEGQFLVQHKHEYSHLSIIAKGKVMVFVDDESYVAEAPVCLEIKAGANHGVKALTDVVWFCIHATDEKDPSKVDEVLIKGE